MRCSSVKGGLIDASSNLNRYKRPIRLGVASSSSPAWTMTRGGAFRQYQAHDKQDPPANMWSVNQDLIRVANSTQSTSIYHTRVSSFLITKQLDHWPPTDWQKEKVLSTCCVNMIGKANTQTNAPKSVSTNQQSCVKRTVALQAMTLWVRHYNSNILNINFATNTEVLQRVKIFSILISADTDAVDAGGGHGWGLSLDQGCLQLRLSIIVIERDQVGICLNKNNTLTVTPMLLLGMGRCVSKQSFKLV